MAGEPRGDSAPLEVADAVARILAEVRALAAVKRPLLDAYNGVLAADAVAPVTLPPWDNSAMDGYACRAADITRVPVTLRVVETIAAGHFPARALGAGEAARIMTGAPVPARADTVVRVEDTDAGIATVEIRDGRDAGRNVRPRGEDIVAGRVAIAAGTTIGAAQIGVLASLGFAEVEVVRAPRVAILTSGDELVELERFDEVRAGRRIVSSNGYTLRALVRAAGAEAEYLGIAADTPQSLRALLERARSCDMIITSAGISVGEHDYMRGVLREMDAEMKFWRVRMRPGAPLAFGLLGGKPWIGLPGNPVSTMVTFELFARPALHKMRGLTKVFRRPVPVVLEQPVTTNAALTHFLRAVVTVQDGRATARLTGPQSSGILTSMSDANALLVVPADRRNVGVGETLNAIFIGDDAERASDFAL
ncbi:MAG: gephyrin-like molybdotransferase Glp [Gemmatimonadales bacterium]